MNRRERTLNRVRSAVGADPDDRAREFIVHKRMRKHERNLVPSRAELPENAQMALLQNMLEAQSATVAHVANKKSVPEAVADFLASHNLPKQIKTGSTQTFENLDWATQLIERKTGAADHDDTVSVSEAVTAASETGTLFLMSGQESPTSLNFLPDNHVIVLSAQDITGSYEDAWNIIRERVDTERRGTGALPRTVNLVSGPSRTGDIEQTIILGAHGPRRLHIIIVDEG